MSSIRPRLRRLLVLTLVLGAMGGGASAARAAVYVFPVPGSRLATPATQISFRGTSAGALASITVTGSSSGIHTGRVEGDSDGRGASFLPTTPFTPGERVTVKTGLAISGSRGGAFSFTVERPAGMIKPPSTRSTPPRVAGDVYLFQTRTDLRPAAIKVKHGRPTGHDIFLTPMRGPLQWGPEIVDPAGRLVWFYPLTGSREQAANLRVQRYHGQPVLTWWQGYMNAGLGVGSDVIFDDHYRQIATVNAGNGLNADLHDFTITPQDTALVTSYQFVHWDASSMGAKKGTAVEDCVIQEIDIPTGLVLFQWDSLDHVPVTASYVHPPKRRRPYDYFHLNSVEQDADGSLIVSGRNTWAVYDIDHRTGKIIWTLGGKHSNFRMGSGTGVAFQHHATVETNGLFTAFDNGASPQVHSQSRAVIERVNTAKRTVTLVRAFEHSPKLVADFEGSAQLLTRGNLFVGWGAMPYFSEFGSKGNELYDARFVDENSSYRAYRFAWTGHPDDPPTVVAYKESGRLSVYVSWNGATGVKSWRVLSGDTPAALAQVAEARPSGFETWIPVPAANFVKVQGLDRSGHVLGTSAVTQAH